MNYCGKCGSELSDQVKFCPKCGAMQKIDIKKYDNNSNNYMRVMPKIQPAMPQENTEIYENSGSKSDIIKLVLIGTLIGAFILGVGYVGYYFYTKNDKISNQQNSGQVSENTVGNKNASSDKDDNTSKDNKESNKVNDTNTLNKETKAGDYIFNDSSNVKLTDAQLSSLSRENLALARNEIYARHGYIFQTEPYKSYFGNKTWYKANPTFKGSDDEINEIERYNVQLLLKYENRK